MKSVVSLVFGLVMRSLPSRGAWIEIGRVTEIRATATRRSPRGERGLKSVVTDPAWDGVVVAPLAGSVD